MFFNNTTMLHKIIMKTKGGLLAVHKGGNITEQDRDTLWRNAKTLKHKKFSSVTKRNKQVGVSDGGNIMTKAYQLHFGKTCYPGKQVKNWVYLLDGKALSYGDLRSIPEPTDKNSPWCIIKRVPLYYERKGTEFIHTNPVGRVVIRWLHHAAEALKISSLTRFNEMMKATEPVTFDGQTYNFRLDPNLPFTNGTINYVDINPSMKVSPHRSIALPITFPAHTPLLVIPSDAQAICSTTEIHKDTNDFVDGASVTESFGYPTASVEQGRLRVKLEGTREGECWETVDVGRMAVGTLHNLSHMVEPAAGDSRFRASLITQVYGPNVTLRRALVKGQHGVAADNQQKVKDMLAGLVPMTEHEVDMATKKKPVSDLYEGMGGLVALERALSLKGNCILYPSKNPRKGERVGSWT